MTQRTALYAELMDDFLARKIDAVSFRQQFFAAFQQEEWLPHNVFRVLDELFADIDAYEPDPEVLRELSAAHPGSYLDEAGLIRAVLRARASLPGS